MNHKPKYEDMDGETTPFFHRFFTNHNLNLFMAGFVCGVIFTIIILSNIGLI